MTATLQYNDKEKHEATVVFDSVFIHCYVYITPFKVIQCQLALHSLRITRTAHDGLGLCPFKTRTSIYA